MIAEIMNDAKKNERKNNDREHEMNYKRFDTVRASNKKKHVVQTKNTDDRAQPWACGPCYRTRLSSSNTHATKPRRSSTLPPSTTWIN